MKNQPQGCILLFTINFIAMTKSTNETHISEKTAYAIITAGVIAYIAFVMYLELNGLA
jgi:hypothetical protein